MLYDLLKYCVSLFFNCINLLLGGRLPPFGTAAVIVEQDEQYLVILLPRGRIVFPGGFMNWREHPREAAMREGLEETGLQLQADHLIGCYSRANTSLFNMSTISFVYHARIVGGRLRKSVEGQPLWLKEEELQRRMDKSSLQLLADYHRYRQITQEQGQAWSEGPIWSVS
ncbi:NUDIX hydrolase [Tengunoibacter tsumagoiensis]|uniref:Nudix hydrolase domain-containing protein n=1 Tax=Tengunoibacter tsumagoiensis TaxID=2014871 RepID=A0A401ZWR2_9CHLR|nr:NUDIX hydrolase [Tengunoibacter tsumagoiensis]GCE11174.1 hypothetical protein KTT_10330 [Tengunoibacter tsumagoiensis]